MNLTVVSFYTPSYKGVMFEYLLPSLEKLSIPYKIYEMESKGNWVKNTNLKAEVAQKAINELDTDILILDADSRIYSCPELFNNPDFDIAFLELKWDEWYKNGSKKKELCTGTLYFKNHEINKELIDRWVKLSEINKDYFTDQQNLEKALKSYLLKIYNLPYEYCWISTLPNGQQPYIERPGKIYIEQFQASRKMKRKI